MINVEWNQTQTTFYERHVEVLNQDRSQTFHYL